MRRLARLCSLSLLLSQGLVAHAEPYNLGAFRLAVMDDPWRIEFQGGAKPVTRQDLEQVVTIVGATRGWKVANSTEGRMELTNVIREHTMSIELTYDATGYGIRYHQCRPGSIGANDHRLCADSESRRRSLSQGEGTRRLQGIPVQADAARICDCAKRSMGIRLPDRSREQAARRRRVRDGDLQSPRKRRV